MPGSSNFLQFDPSFANADSDATYAADTLRSGGATVNAILPSALDNKFRIQMSFFVAAFCQMMANKGYVMSDSNYTNLVTALTNVRTNADVVQKIQTITYATSITFNAAIAPAFDLTLTGNVSASTLSGISAGAQLIFIFQQDGTGGRTFSWPTGVTGHGAIAAQPNSVSIQAFIVRSDGATIDPMGPMLVISSGGIILPTTFLPTVWPSTITANGTIPSVYAWLFERVDCTGGAVTRTMFSTANAVPAGGQQYTAKKIDASGNVFTLLAGSGQTIEGAASIGITRQYNSATIIFDGVSNWSII